MLSNKGEIKCFSLLIFVCYCWGPQTVAYLAQPLCWSGWENLLPYHSQGSSTERWSQNTLRVVTTRVFYVLRGFLTSPVILNNSVETAAPFNVVSHPRLLIENCFPFKQVGKPIQGSRLIVRHSTLWSHTCQYILEPMTWKETRPNTDTDSMAKRSQLPVVEKRKADWKIGLDTWWIIVVSLVA